MLQELLTAVNALHPPCGNCGENRSARITMTREISRHRRDDAHLRALRLLDRNPHASRRELASELGISLGAAQNCFAKLLELGAIARVRDARALTRRRQAYALTPLGKEQKASLATAFICRSLTEQNALAAELEDIRREIGASNSGDAEGDHR